MFDYGFSQFQHQDLVRIISAFPMIKSIKIFGSRAKGTYKVGSDADLAVFGDDISYETIAALSYELNEESILPFYFDVIDANKISSTALVEHIEKFGIEIYSRLP